MIESKFLLFVLRAGFLASMIRSKRFDLCIIRGCPYTDVRLIHNVPSVISYGRVLGI